MVVAAAGGRGRVLQRVVVGGGGDGERWGEAGVVCIVEKIEWEDRWRAGGSAVIAVNV